MDQTEVDSPGTSQQIDNITSQIECDQQPSTSQQVDNITDQTECIQEPSTSQQVDDKTDQTDGDQQPSTSQKVTRKRTKPTLYQSGKYEPKIKKKKGGRFRVIGDEVLYRTDTPRMTKIVASKNPAVLQKSYLKKVVRKMQEKKKNAPKKIRHKLVEEYGGFGELALQRCKHPSIDVIINDLAPATVNKCTIDTLLRRIRSAMLDHRWSHCFALYVRLLHVKNLHKRLSIYLLRVIIIAVLNSKIGGDELDEFLRVTFGLSNRKSRQEFLNSLFLLPEQLKGVSTRGRAPKKEPDAEEEEDISDSNETSSEEDD